MAHTLFEQEHTFSSVENSAGEINDIFVQQFGYTQNGDYYFSPVDTNFGVRWYISGSYLYCYVTFDGGVTEINLINITTATALPKFNYHVSKMEKVIYLRIYYQSSSSTSNARSVEIVIAHDDINKTICFKGQAYNASNSSSNRTVYMLDAKKTVYTFDYVNAREHKVNENFSNAVFHYPSLGNYCFFNELYGIVKIQAFNSISDTYINFSGQIYRVIGCFDNVNSDTAEKHIPYFAFPVSD